MSRTLQDINSSIRTILALGVVGALGYGWYAVSYAPGKQLEAKQQELHAALEDVADLRSAIVGRDQQIATLQAGAEEQAAEIDRLSASLALLKVDQRVAELHVVDQQKTDEGVVTTLEFVETSPEGKRVGEPRRFDVAGERVYVDYLVVKFNDELVERADVERGTAICLFQRVFGNQQQADDGFTLDAPGTRPTAYARGGATSEFEERFWKDFWALAHDEQELQRLGVRAMQGAAPYYKVQPGETYRLSLRTDGDFTFTPVDSAPSVDEEE